MPYIVVGSELLFYLRRSGGGEDAASVLFLHGAGGNGLLWGHVLDRLAGTNAIAPDLPGHGRSQGPGCRTVGGYSDAVVALAESLHLDNLVVAGHSMGGAIALDVALRAPERVRALVLMAVTARLLVAPALLQRLVEDPAAARQWIIDNGYGPETPPEARQLGAEQLAQVPSDVLHGDFLACSGFDVRAHLREIGCPALVLGGSDDRLTPPRYVRALAEGLPAGRFELLPGAGHMLPLERPEAVAGAVTRFLNSPGLSRALLPPDA